MIPYGRQFIDQEDIDAVTAVLKSDFLTQGPAIPRFESALAKYCGAAHAAALSSATAALHASCRALGLAAGDILWTSPNTFPATSNAGLFCGASVDFVDIDPRTYNMCAKALRTKLEAAKASGRLPKIVIPVHFGGQSCDMESIRALSKEFGFFVIEDASHCIGGDYKGRKIGCCDYSDLCVFSFHPVKIMTTGEGGAVTTNSEDLYKKVMLFRSHGITRDEAQFQDAPHGGWYYEQIDLSTNYRMTDIQAALGTSQLDKLDGFIRRRRVLAKQYDDLFADVPDIRPHQNADTESSWHLYVVQVPNRLDVYNRLKDAGIGANVHYIPVHMHPYYKSLGFKTGDFPNAESYYEQTITLPLYYGLTDEEQKFTADTLKEILKERSKAA